MEPTGEVSEQKEVNSELITIYEGPIVYYFRSTGIEEGTHVADDLKEGITLRTKNGGKVENEASENTEYTGVATPVGLDQVMQHDIEGLLSWTPEGEEPLTRQEIENATILMINYLNGAKWAIQSEGVPIPKDVTLSLLKYSDPEYSKRASAAYDKKNHRINFNRSVVLEAARAPHGIHSNMDNTVLRGPYLEYQSQPHELHAMEKRLEDVRREAQYDEDLKDFVPMLEGLIVEVKEYQETKSEI